MNSIATRRPSITEVLNRLDSSDRAGSRERAILLDLDSKSCCSAEYPGCLVITSPIRGQMVYHVANNTIVG